MGPHSLRTRVVVSASVESRLGLSGYGQRTFHGPGCNLSMCCVSSECASGWSCVVWFGKFSDVLADTGLFVQVLAMDPFEVAVSSHQS